MGYRSEVMIQVKDELKDEFIALCKDAELETIDGVLHEDSTKWYSSDPKILAIELWLLSLDDEDYGFIRIGEDIDDFEYLGNPSEFGMYMRRTIETL